MKAQQLSRRGIALSFATVVGLVAVRFWIIQPASQEMLLKEATGNGALDFVKMQRTARTFQAEAPHLDDTDRKRAVLGRALFFDTDLSKNGKIACASCHKPDKSFTDGRSKAVGLSERPKNTPTLINSFTSFWFYWDGRTDSLASQSLNPLEDEAEHGFSRAELAQIIFKKYRSQYETLFGRLPADLITKLRLPAKPTKEVTSVSDNVIRFAIASTVNPKLIRDLGSLSFQSTQAQLRQYRSKLSYHSDQDPQSVSSINYNQLTEPEKKQLNQVFANIGLSIEAFEKGIVAIESPFDAFIQRWSRSSDPKPQAHFSKDFGFKEFLGFQLFLGKASCHTCHTGPYFKDNQFHNIGLPSVDDSLDLGRSQGIKTVKSDPFNCQGAFFNSPTRRRSESCKDLSFLDSETPEAIGAFKTPTLRNIAETAPYMRDGRFSNLRQVLEHYNRMDTHSGVGFREETLKPLNLSETELEALKSFLESLSSPVKELTQGTT